MRILIVDDSITFRSAIKAVLSDEKDMEIVGNAPNGKIALAKLLTDTVDVMIMDLDMPEMDGIETLRAMQKMGLKVLTLIYASPTPQSYQKVSEALRLGAYDFLAKSIPTENASGPEAAKDAVRKELVSRLRSIAKAKLNAGSSSVSPVPSDTSLTNEWPKLKIDEFLRPQVVVIASSTGGPMALEKLFSKLSKYSRVPILLVQHMPKYFTAGLARRISDLTGILCNEGIDGEAVQSNRIYIAPGDYHMTIARSNGQNRIVLDQLSQINFVRPAADPLFSTVAELFKHSVLGFVLTGMGEDGKQGSAAIKRFGGAVMIQDKQSSVVWGMPGAVAGINAFDREGSIDECATVLAAVCQR